MLGALVWNPDPIAFTLLGKFSFTWYGLTWSATLIAAYFLGNYFFEKENKDKTKVTNMVIFVFVGALVGARLGQVVFYDLAYFIKHPADIVKVWNGGLASHGAILATFLSCYLFSKQHKDISFWWLVDKVAITVLAGGALIRIGNFFNSELYGKATQSSFGVVFSAIDNLVRHPVQLYESVWLFVCFVFIMLVYARSIQLKKPKFNGFYTAFFLVVTLFGRLCLEFFKEDVPVFIGLSRTQWLSVAMVLVGIVLYVVLNRKDKLA